MRAYRFPTPSYYIIIFVLEIYHRHHILGAWCREGSLRNSVLVPRMHFRPRAAAVATPGGSEEEGTLLIEHIAADRCCYRLSAVISAR